MKAWLQNCFSRQNRWAVTLWLIALLICSVIIGRSQFTADLSAFLPKSPTAAQRLLVDQLRDGLVSRLILIGIEGGDAQQRATLSQAYVQELQKQHGNVFTTISNGTLANQEKDREILFSHRYLLSPAVNAEHFSVNGLKQSISDSIDLLTSPMGMMVKQLIPQDPTGEIAKLLERISNGKGPSTQEGVWASKDGKQALLIAQTQASGSDSDGQAIAVEALRSTFEHTQVALNKAGALTNQNIAPMHLVLSGPGVFAVQARQTIQSEVSRLAILSMCLILLLLLIVYRSLLAVLLGLLPVLSGALVGIAAVSLGYGTVHGITLGFGTTLIGEAVDYSIYLFVQSQENTTQDKRKWVERFWPTIRLGVLTSIAGFTSLLVSGFPGLSQLGMYSIAGLVAAALVTRFVLPALLPTTFKVRDVAPYGHIILKHLHVIQQKHIGRTLVVICLGISAITVSLNYSTMWNRELSGLSPISAQDQALDAKMRSDLNAPDVRYLIALSAPDSESALQASELAEAPLQAMVAKEYLQGFDSPSHYLPSQTMQTKRIAALPDQTILTQNLKQALVGLPIEISVLTPFIQAVEKARQQGILQRADLRGSSMGLALDGLLVHPASSSPSNTSTWTALIPLRLSANALASPEKTKQAIQAIQATLIDLKSESDAIYANYLQEAMYLSLAGLLVIILLLAFALKNLASIIRVMLPLFAAVLVVMAGLIICNQQLTILHLVGLLLIVAVGSNYALFFEHRPQAKNSRENIAPRTLVSLIIANFTTVIGFGLLAFSSVPVLQAMGETVGPGAVLALCFSALLAKSYSEEKNT